MSWSYLQCIRWWISLFGIIFLCHFQQGWIHGKTVADSWAGVVVHKPPRIQECEGPTEGPTNQLTQQGGLPWPRLKMSSVPFWDCDNRSHEWYVCDQFYDHLSSQWWCLLLKRLPHICWYEHWPPMHRLLVSYLIIGWTGLYKMIIGWSWLMKMIKASTPDPDH